MKLNSIMIALATIVLVTICSSSQAANVDVTPEVEKALLSEDWSKVADLLTKVDTSTPSPVLRILKAHACLALNRNNEALAHFLALSDKDTIKSCLEWTTSFLKSHPSSALAFYLHGDALARGLQPKEAFTTFTRGLALKQDHTLLLHARGVLLANLGDFDGASSDFSTASKANPKFAELYLSRGTYTIQKKTDPKKGLQWFTEALRISPDYVLGLNGKGAILIMMRQMPEAKEALTKAKSLSKGPLAEIEPVIDGNLSVLDAKVNAAIDNRLTTLAGIKPGMSLDEKVSRFDSADASTRQAIVDSVYNARANNASRLGDFTRPSEISVGSTFGAKVSVVGPELNAGVNMGAKWDTKSTEFNLKNQDDFLKAASDRGVRPSFEAGNPMNNFKSWWNNQFGSARDFSHSGGVSSAAIGDGTDRGAWEVYSCYGLQYRFQTKP